ncbi:MAG: LytR family transcriptional regulator [Anaerofustis stercorihominis]|nr:LytR family transcriptional regulator [Anaerofustis stercorihominis]
MTDNMNKQPKKRGKKKIALMRISFYALLIATAVTLAFLAYIGLNKVLTGKFLVIIAAVLIGLLCAGFVSVILWGKRSKTHPKRSKIVNNIAIMMSVLLSMILGFASFYIMKMDQSVASLQNTTYNTSVKLYCLNEVLVDKDPGLDIKRSIDKEYDNIMTLVDTVENMDSVTIAYRDNIDTENNNNTIEKINEILGENGITPVYETYIDFDSMVNDLYDGKVDFILFNDAFVDVIMDHFDDFETKCSYAYYANFSSDILFTANVDDITKEAFVVYISGHDTRGNRFSDTARTDVNILAVVNPVDKKVLLISTPRDYYVPLWGQQSKMDKLTHAGVYGVECAIETLNALYDVEIDYYVKVNFNSVVDIIDALGGIKVDSEYEFSSKYSLSGKRYYFEEGTNTLSGDAALAFCRERYSLPGGDRARGINQQAVIKGVINKVISPDVVTKLTDILDAISDNVRTNIDTSSLYALANMQLIDMSPWDITTISATGSDAHRTTYSGGSMELYVMLQNETLINKIKGMANEVIEMDAEELDNLHSAIEGN